ncbi:2Fe-2S iron-sulfur cluster-binding protein [Thalassotalea mangrovi]|uniref:2Fe-2S iron-sulfur cluster binding domain-containing protein n=1 Tax=Thalassotalea mangrovi TaxID=2572245 RepID=A0A4U1B1U6_9GAMM|nr:2Fe-2S iron-sulfur cluster-binding protein [Thalassotalea mangrovi]TKB43196.1 2Fe-2S iron-sulfur cluster binding domain-containing protein [Thalassotalea mangrovi]
MAKITFITTNNDVMEVEGSSGSVMELAVENNVPGIYGDCGGVCSCATCHVHVAPDDMAKVGEQGEIEKDLLDMNDCATEYSRLSCQIEVSDAIDGITLTVAEY